ncbi:MAG: glycoside hydrolase family 16 protein, partial [Spirochaetales bacterium]|nr:glycoside hydrolase family 16 protein [Spirochaetales bacterium]
GSSPVAEPASNGDPWYGGTLLWSSEFNGSSINTSKWAFDTGGGGWGNNELETYTTANASIQNVQDGNYIDSCLVITASKDANGNWTSARLKTEGLQSFTYGKIEARIKLPYGPGMWPAFWMLGSDIPQVGWPQCGETDIMEMIGNTNTTSSTAVPSNSTIYGTLHWWNGSSGSDASYQPENYTLPSGIFADAFHTFGVVWTSTSITFYVDGVAQASVTPDSTTGTTFQKSFFILLNLAVGGNWPGNPTSATISPQTMDVDWVRVYQ